jgi:hypothetical protein
MLNNRFLYCYIILGGHGQTVVGNKPTNNDKQTNDISGSGTTATDPKDDANNIE